MLNSNMPSDVVPSLQGIVAQRIAKVGQSNVSISIICCSHASIRVENLDILPALKGGDSH